MKLVGRSFACTRSGEIRQVTCQSGKVVPPPVLESPAGGHVGKPYCLPRRWDLRRYSECFDWATAGPGAMQLAIAMLADHVGPAHVDDAVNRHEEFARVVVAALPQVQWTLHEREISFFLNVDIES